MKRRKGLKTLIASTLYITLILSPLAKSVGILIETNAYAKQDVNNYRRRLVAGSYINGVIGHDNKIYAAGLSYSPPNEYAVNSDIMKVPEFLEEFEIKSATTACGSFGIITENDELYTVGWNVYGMCGNGTFESSVNKIMDNVKSVSMSETDHTLIVTNDGKLYGCGSNAYGQLLEENDSAEACPVFLMDGVVSAVAGGDMSAVIKEDQCLYTWGRNDYGCLGTGNFDSKGVPQKIMENVKSVSANLYNMAALLENGDLYVWGANSYGQVGNGEITTEQLVPVKIMEDVKEVYVGYQKIMALKINGDLYAWGRNIDGVLTLPESIRYTSTPTKIMEDVQEVAFCALSGTALTKDGNVWAWGSNYNGVLGVGDEITKSDRPLNVFNIYTGLCEGLPYDHFYQQVHEFNYNKDQYNQTLATESGLYAMLAYDDYRKSVNYYYPKKNGRRNKPELLIRQMQKDGYTSIISSSTYRDNNPDNVSYTLGARKILYKGKSKTQILICIRGTDGVEWGGNMKLTGMSYSEDEKDTHYSFRRGKECVINAFDRYINQLKNSGYDVDDPVILVTGHSRGGAVANLVSADLTDKSEKSSSIGDVFAYTFATANATTLYKTKNYTNIFNHCFKDDFVPSVPLDEWNYGNYGITYSAIAEELYNNNVAFMKGMENFKHICAAFGDGRPGVVFDYSATSKMLKYISRHWKSSEAYYKKSMGVSLFDLMFYGIAPLAQRNWINLAITYVMEELNKELDYVLLFFVRGGSTYINDTHQAYTYYLAVKNGLFIRQSSSEVLDASKSSNAAFSQDKISLENNMVEEIVSENSISGNDTRLDHAGVTSAVFSEEEQRLVDIIKSNEELELLGWNPENPDSWDGITWDQDGYVTSVDLSYTGLSGTLDLSGFNHLQSLSCAGNDLAEINVTGCEYLKSLDCYYNSDLAKLDLMNCINLQYLDCADGSLQSIDFSGCTALREIICSDNELMQLDVSNLTQLEELICDNNVLYSITLPEGDVLKRVFCYSNYLENLSELELLSEKEENWIIYEDQKIASDAVFCETDVENLKEQFALKENEAVTGWDLSAPETWYGITWVKVDGVYYVSSLDLSNTGLKGAVSLDGFAELEGVSVAENDLTSLKIANCPKLTTVNCMGNQLDELKLSQCNAVKDLLAYYNYLSRENMDELEQQYTAEDSILELKPQYIKGNAEQFDSQEIKDLLNLAEQKDNEISIYLDPEAPGTWEQVKWEKQDDGIYHVSELDFSESLVLGELDLSHMHYLKSFDLHNSGISKVKFPEELEEIPCKALYGCTLLETILVPESVKRIDDLAFAECSNLKKIEFLCGNAELGSNLDYNSHQLTTIKCYPETTEFEYSYGIGVKVVSWYAADEESEKTEFKENSKADTSLTNQGGAQNSTADLRQNQNAGYSSQSQSTDGLKAGTILKVGDVNYKIVKNSKNGGTVSYVKCTNKKEKSIVIPAKIKVKGKTYKIVEVGKNAFKDNKKITKVTIGKNVTAIRQGAFCGCKNLKNVIIKTAKLKKVEKNAFRNTYKKIKIKVPIRKKKAYKKLFQKKNVKLPKRAHITI